MVLPNGFWAVDGFSGTKSRLLAAFPARKLEIQEMQGALEMASGKGAGIAKSTILVLLWGSPPFTRSIAKSTILVLLWGSPHFGGLGSRKSKKYRGPWKWPPEKERVLQNREMASGKGAGIANSTISVLLWGSPHYGGLGSRKSKKYKGP